MKVVSAVDGTDAFGGIVVSKAVEIPETCRVDATVSSASDFVVTCSADVVVACASDSLVACAPDSLVACAPDSLVACAPDSLVACAPCSVVACGAAASVMCGSVLPVVIDTNVLPACVGEPCLVDATTRVVVVCIAGIVVLWSPLTCI